MLVDEQERILTLCFAAPFNKMVKEGAGKRDDHPVANPDLDLDLRQGKEMIRLVGQDQNQRQPVITTIAMGTVSRSPVCDTVLVIRPRWWKVLGEMTTVQCLCQP